MNGLRVVWMDGELLPADDARVGILTHTLHYGYGVFEGTRAFKCHKGGGSSVFRLQEHLERLRRSATTIGIEIPYTDQQLAEATVATLKACQLKEGYLRHIVYIDDAAAGLHVNGDGRVRVAIMAFAWPSYLSANAMTKGSRVMIASLRRPHRDCCFPGAKICGQYVGSVIAKRFAKMNGFDEAIMCDQSGRPVEGTGQNLFIVKNGVLITPPTGSIMPGFTRDSIIQMARGMGLTVEERYFNLEELYTADEVFICGTATDVAPVVEVQCRKIGDGTPGPITKKIAKGYGHLVTQHSEAVFNIGGPHWHHHYEVAA